MKDKLFWMVLATAVAAFLLLPVPHAKAPMSTVILDRDGHVMKAFLAADDRWRIAYPDSMPVPRKLLDALLVYEDKRFFLHPGVDPFAAGRALVQNFKTGRRTSGASTLTMQVARLSHPKARTVWAKLYEMLQALKLEVLYGKEHILRMYLTHAPYGSNVVGIRGAAFRAFGRDVDLLTWAETCALVVLPRSPSNINLYENTDRLLARRNVLLERLHQAGVIGDSILHAALREAPPGHPFPMPDLAPHLGVALAGSHEGETVRSTIDPSLQRAAQDITRRWAAEMALYNIPNTALLVAETRTGKVRAYVGSQDFSDSANQGQVDGVRAPRSSGSILKPFLYALAIQNGKMAPQTLLPDVPMRFGNFEPVNAGETYAGAATVHQCLVQSLNIPAVFVLREYGTEPFYGFLKDAGCSTLFRSAEDYGLSLIIGGVEVTPWDVAALYRGLGREGVFSPLTVVENEKPGTDRRLLDPGAAYLVLNILQDVKRPGSEYSPVFMADAHPIAWKTGTSFRQKDAWAAGVSPDWTVVVWAGSFSGEPNRNLMGAKVAGRLLFQIYQQLPKTRGWFEKPLEDLKPVTLCADSGYAWTPACGPRAYAMMPACAAPLPPCPYHKEFFVDDRTGREVCSLCWDASHVKKEARLIFTPKVAAYLRKEGTVVRDRPVHEPSCPGFREAGGLQILYPMEDSRILLPREYDGALQPLVLRVAVGKEEGEILWFMDRRFVGKTSTSHELTLNLEPGMHRLMVVDSGGRSKSVEFEVVPRSAA